MFRTLASSMLITRLYTNLIELMNCGNVSRLWKTHLLHISTWSTNTNLAFNQTKTKIMMLTTQQMSRCHGLDGESIAQITINNELIERVSGSSKMLGVHFQQNLHCNIHVSELASSCYGVLASLRKLKRYAPFHIRKQLVETLILPKLDYCNVLYDSMPAYLIKMVSKGSKLCIRVCAGPILE